MSCSRRCRFCFSVLRRVNWTQRGRRSSRFGEKWRGIQKVASCSGSPRSGRAATTADLLIAGAAMPQRGSMMTGLAGRPTVALRGSAGDGADRFSQRKAGNGGGHSGSGFFLKRAARPCGGRETRKSSTAGWFVGKFTPQAGPLVDCRHATNKE